MSNANIQKYKKQAIQKYHQLTNNTTSKNAINYQKSNKEKCN